MYDRARLPATTSVVVERGRWGVSAGVFLEILAASIALIGLIEGSGWWWALTGTAALLLALPAALRSAGVRPWPALLVDAAAFAALMQLIFTPRASVLGIIPTGETVNAFHDDFRQAIVSIQLQHIPAEALPELMFFIVLFGGVFALLLESLALVLRVPALTAVALGGVLAVPAILQPDGLTLTALGAAAAAWFVLLKADGRIRFGTRGGNAVALAVGASATLLSLIVASTAPGFVEQGRTSETGPVAIGGTINTLVDLGKDLREPTPVNVLQYTSTTKQTLYLQLTTLDQFYGTTWTHSTNGPIARPRRDGQVGAAPGLDQSIGVKQSSFTATFHVQNLRSLWVPAPYPATKVTGTPPIASYQPDDLTLYAQGSTLKGEQYTTTTTLLEPTRAQLEDSSRRASQDPAALDEVKRDLFLPDHVPQIITDTAEQIRKSVPTPTSYDLAVAIQAYFQSSLNGFSYSTETPDSIDGTSLAVVARFLQVKEGYCVHFATAMAVLARVLGIPSRIAIGYLPGQVVGSKGKAVTYQVDSSQLHAWPQLYFPGIGWLNFEPTVSRGAAPYYSLQTSTDPFLGDTPQQDTPGTATAPSETPSATPVAAAPTSTGDNATAARNGVPAGLGLLLVLAALASPAVTRALRRRGRLTRLREEGSPPTLAWDEVRDTARDLGYAVSATETPRAFAARLRADWHPDAAHRSDFDGILEQIELTAYGPPRPWERYFELADKTVSVTAALRASRPWHARLAATLLPVSLFTSRGERQLLGARAE